MSEQLQQTLDDNTTILSTSPKQEEQMLKQSIFIILTRFLSSHLPCITNNCKCSGFFMPFFQQSDSTSSTFLITLWPWVKPRSFPPVSKHRLQLCLSSYQVWKKLVLNPCATAPTASLRRVKLSQLSHSAAEDCLCRKLTVSCVNWVEWQLNPGVELSHCQQQTDFLVDYHSKWYEQHRLKNTDEKQKEVLGWDSMAIVVQLASFAFKNAAKWLRQFTYKDKAGSRLKGKNWPIIITNFFFFKQPANVWMQAIFFYMRKSPNLDSLPWILIRLYKASTGFIGPTGLNSMSNFVQIHGATEVGFFPFLHNCNLESRSQSHIVSKCRVH